MMSRCKEHLLSATYLCWALLETKASYSYAKRYSVYEIETQVCCSVVVRDRKIKRMNERTKLMTTFQKPYKDWYGSAYKPVRVKSPETRKTFYGFF